MHSNATKQPGSTITASSPSVLPLKRKKSAFALGLAKIVPKILRRISGKSMEESLPALNSSDSTNNILARHRTLPHASSTPHSPYLQPLNLPSSSSRQAASSTASLRNLSSLFQASNPRPTASRNLSESNLLTGATLWTSSDGYVHAPPLSAPPSRPTPSPTFGKRAAPCPWVSEVSSGFQRVPSNSAALEEAARKVSNGELKPWEDGGDASRREEGTVSREQVNETLVWVVADSKQTSLSENYAESEKGDVVSMLATSSEGGRSSEDAFQFTHHLTPSLSCTTTSGLPHALSFDLSPWAFPAPSSAHHRQQQRQSWIRPSAASSSLNSSTASAHQPDSVHSTSPSQTALASHPHRLSNRSSYEGTGFSFDDDRRSSFRIDYLLRGERRRSDWTTEDEQEPVTPREGEAELPEEGGKPGWSA